MTENDLPPEDVNHGREAWWSAPPPPPRRRRSRAGIALVIALLVGAAIVLAAYGISHVSATPASASGAPGSGSGASPSMSRAVPSTGPLTTSAIAAKVDPGLVDINVTFGIAKAQGAATGMVLTPSGEVLTNNHVIRGATVVKVTDIGNGRTYSAHVVGYDRTHDVAVLQLQGASGLQTVPLGDSSAVTVGTRVTALGNAGGVGGTPKVARGSVVALGQAITASDGGGVNVQRLTGLIETNAAIRPGDSGGPLVTSTGRVVAMDAAASASFTAQPTAPQGYAIPINEALGIARQIEAGQPSATVHIGSTGFLGVEIVPPGHPSFGVGATNGAPGAVVGGVLPGYPARQAGLSQGDVITSVDGQSVTSPAGLTALLAAHHPGDAVQIVWSDPSGRTHTATIRLAGGPPA